MDRRTFVKGIGLAGASTLAPKLARAQAQTGGQEFNGLLVDTTRCAGCRSCEEACAKAHGLPVPNINDESVFRRLRSPSETGGVVVNRFQTSQGECFVRKSCMHCNQPACASACLVKSMYKTKEGPVVWRAGKCMGCRFCMISCPFDIPRFEYDKAVPRILKCEMCWERQQQGSGPACVAACPAEAIVFGKRRELLEEARKRIYAQPGQYISQIYGEHEVGGTGLLYLAKVPFEQLGFKTDLGTTPYPELTKGFLYSVPVVLLLWPSFLAAVSYSRRRTAIEQGSEENHEQH